MVKLVQAPEGADPVRTGGDEPQPVRTDNPHQAESLDSLAAEARTLEAPPPPAAGELAEARREAARAEDEIADVLLIMRDAAAPVVEDAGYLRAGQTREIWTDAALRRLAGPIVQIMARHGVGLAEVMARFGPYVMLGVGLALPAVATVRAIRDNKAARAGDGQPQPA